MRLADFDYHLPQELIATHPPAARRDSRLLCLDAGRDALRDRVFSDLPELLQQNDLLVFNDTRVIRARLRGRKASGGKVEILLERVQSARTALAQVRASKPPRSGGTLLLQDAVEARICGRNDDLYELQFNADIAAILERQGEMPLPPYLGRDEESADAERYQTVYAKHDGAVAAPTAGLHFDPEMLRDLGCAGIRSAFVTLHVGAGTFQSLREENVLDNRLHAERICVDPSVCAAVAAARHRGGRVIAVGTTTVRALESAAADGELRSFDGESDLFIVPGYRFRVVDGLLTNFHLPRSSLIMLVCAFAGRDAVLRSYRHAIHERYRFFSYGDAMFVLPQRSRA